MTTQSSDAMEQVARAIHDARYGPDYPAFGRTDFADEDESGREYCFRLARAAIAALPSNATTNASLVEALEGLIVQATQVHQARMGDEDWDALEAAIADGTSALATLRASNPDEEGKHG